MPFRNACAGENAPAAILVEYFRRTALGYSCARLFGQGSSFVAAASDPDHLERVKKSGKERVERIGHALL